MDLKNKKGNINIIKDADGKWLVIVNDIRFKGRRGIDWYEVEAYSKANIAQAVGDLIKIATNKRISPDYDNKHKSKARNGWYRYDVRFALPVYGVRDELERYNIFTARLVVRHDRDGKLYLYDILRTKKETSRPSGQ